MKRLCFIPIALTLAILLQPASLAATPSPSSNDNWDTPITGPPPGGDPTASTSNDNWDTPITGPPPGGDPTSQTGGGDTSQTGGGGTGIPSIPNISGIPNIFGGGSSVGNFGSILKLLGLPSWLTSFNRLLSDPCGGASVMYIVAPEPGWCQARGQNSSKTVSATVNGSAGNLGIPNPNESREDLGKDIENDTTVPDFYETNPTVYSQEMGNLADRVATHQSVESVLGKNAQQTTAQALQETQSLVTASASAANSAQKLQVSQEILKLLIANSARSNAIQAAMSSQLTGLRVDQQFANLGTTDISRTLDENARRERFNDAVSSTTILSLSAQAGLMEGSPQ